MVVKAINDGMGNITDWKVGQVDGTDLIVIDYEGMYCDRGFEGDRRQGGRQGRVVGRGADGERVPLQNTA